MTSPPQAAFVTEIGASLALMMSALPASARSARRGLYTTVIASLLGAVAFLWQQELAQGFNAEVRLWCCI